MPSHNLTPLEAHLVMRLRRREAELLSRLLPLEEQVAAMTTQIAMLSPALESLQSSLQKFLALPDVPPSSPS